LFTELLGNPTLQVADIRALAEIARRRGLHLVVDNTFTPMVCSPVQLGADVCVTSLTKFVNGASDLIAGAICASREFVQQLMDLHIGRAMLLGPTLDPRVAFDVIQRLPHLPLRMREHGRRALAMAERLEKIGAPVCYPGLASHPQHQRFGAMANPGYGYGGVLTLDCGTRERADRLLAALQNQTRFGLIAVSLGYYDTLASCSGSTTASEIEPEAQAAIGISPGLVRLSVGYTGTLEDRVCQVEEAVRSAGLA
ncbi:MAG TPA: PLP-dependent transferase, partial [Deferrisomatales bacterium]|nr:PLP-dependent transferase [Deferrisomatales bacterium]